MILLSLLYIGNAIFNAILFGVYFDLLEQARSKANEFERGLNKANSAMQNLQLKNSVSKQVEGYILSTYESKLNQKEFIDFSHLMSPSLLLKITSHNFSRVLTDSFGMI